MEKGEWRRRDRLLRDVVSYTERTIDKVPWSRITESMNANSSECGS